MLTRDESYIVMKLSTGEQVMGILEQEDSTHFQILDPIIIRTIPVPSEGREHVTAHPYCQWTNDNIFDIAKQNVIFIKPLLATMIPHYLRIVKEHESGPGLQTGNQKQDLDWDSEEEISETEDEELGYFIEGNDTKH